MSLIKEISKWVGIGTLVGIVTCNPIQKEEETETFRAYAYFTQSATQICTGETISFDASRSTSAYGELVSYNWDFDDGSNGSGRKTSHTYYAVGFFNPRLEVTDENGYKDRDHGEVEVFSKLSGYCD